MCRPGACRGSAGGGAWRAAAGLGYGARLRGGALLPLDAGFGPKLVGPLPRRRARVSGALAVGAYGLGARVLGARPAGTGGLEARAARTAIPRPGRAEDSERPRRQRGGPGSVRLAGGRGHRARVRPGATGRPRAGSELKPGGRGRGWSAGPWFGGSFVRGRHVEDGGVGDSVVEGGVVEGCVKRCVVEGGRGEPLAGQVTLGVPGGRALRLGGDALWLGGRRSLAGRPAVGGRAGTIPLGLRRRARNRRQRLALRQPAQGRARIAGHQLPAGAGLELSGPAARTRGA